MAGVIPKMVSVVNRTTSPLDAMFDGQPIVVPPGYKAVTEGEGKDAKTRIVGNGPADTVLSYALPMFAAEMVKRQNPRLGTEDPTNPADFESLIGVIEWDDEIDHIEQSDAQERMDRSLLDDEAQSATTIRKRSATKRKKGGRRHSDPKLKAPMGTRADYEG